MSEEKRFIVLAMLLVASIGLFIAATNYNDDAFLNQIKSDVRGTQATKQ